MMKLLTNKSYRILGFRPKDIQDNQTSGIMVRSSPKLIQYNRRAFKMTGFTLIEILVAITIFAIMSALAYSGLNTTIFNNKIIEEATNELQQLQMSISIIQRDINQIVNRKTTNKFGDMYPALTTDESVESVLSLTRNGWKNPAGQIRSHLQRVNYNIEENVLYRYFWATLDQANEAEPQKAKLLENVESMEFRFLDKENNWHPQWPPIGQDRRFPDLPIAVEVTLKSEIYGEIKRLLAITI